ncbi:MAG: hypothetical protein GVY19_04105 [Bacteroidetes bacterium]|jgi:Spy/CpxP family protein refolding chaperone|nr:hypothetical protein [Bacteroidota bacterium]
MKTIAIQKTMLMGSIIMLLSVTSGFAQPCRGYGKGMGTGSNCPVMQGQQFCANLPGITDEQLNQIETLRVGHFKKMNTLRNEVALKRAELAQLETTDNRDDKAVNAKIDKLYQVKTQMAKERSTHRQQVRNLLTDDQKVYFDARRGRGQCKGYGRGMGMCRNWNGGWKTTNQ